MELLLLFLKEHPELRVRYMSVIVNSSVIGSIGIFSGIFIGIVRPDLNGDTSRKTTIDPNSQNPILKSSDPRSKTQTLRA